MSSIIEGYNYDIFISYRQKDNKGDRWVSEFVEALKTELESTFKEEISVYFDINPHDGLLETHDVDASLKEKLKCLVFIPIISRIYCDPKSFAWEHEFKAFVEQASIDKFGLKVKLPNGNIASRVLPVRIYNLDVNDIKLCESILGGVLRGVDFIYKSPGVNRPLRSREEKPQDNLNNTLYRDQINKVANSIKEIANGLRGEPLEFSGEQKEVITTVEKPTLQEKSIIVLPFENISPDPDQEYFSDGLTEEIITDLSHINDLLVISRSSAMTFKSTNKKINEIAEEVNVHYVLEGSVRKAGNNLRITAQLIDGITDSHIWAEKYSGTLDDVFDIQEKVSRSISNALKLKLSPEETKKITVHNIDNIQVYEYYLKAFEKINEFTEDSINKALKHLQIALEITGDNAMLYSCIAYAYFNLVNMGIKQEDYLEIAENYAKKALFHDPESSLAYTVLGYIDFFRGRMLKSLPSFKKALEINPREEIALVGILSILYLTGKISEAAPLKEKLTQIDPLSVPSNWCRGAYYYYNGQFCEALPLNQKFFQLHPDNSYSQFEYSLLLIYNEKINEAIPIIDQNARMNKDNVLAKLGLILKYSLQGDKVKILNEMNQDFQETVSRDCSYAHHLAGFLSLANFKKEALNWLEISIKNGMINYPLLNNLDPFLENIRGEEQFKKLMERVKYEWENFEV
jgi:TolB-like protein